MVMTPRCAREVFPLLNDLAREQGLTAPADCEVELMARPAAQDHRTWRVYLRKTYPDGMSVYVGYGSTPSMALLDAEMQEIEQQM